MEVIICTPSISGRLVNELCQNLAPSKRGQDTGDVPQNKTSLSTLLETKKTKNSFSNKNNLITLKSPFWVGGFVALALVGSIFTSMPKAHAADNWSNKDLVAAIKNVGVTPASQADEKISTDKPVDNYIEKPLVVETQITPVRQVLAAQYQRQAVDYSLVKGPHYFPYGYCTYYVSQKREIIWSGNAGTWLAGAKSAGKDTGKTPQVGAIMVTSEGGKAGHVAYVEAVSGDKVTISEMNFKGYGIVSTRTIAANSKFIKGYIY